MTCQFSPIKLQPEQPCAAERRRMQVAQEKQDREDDRQPQGLKTPGLTCHQ